MVVAFPALEAIKAPMETDLDFQSSQGRMENSSVAEDDRAVQHRTVAEQKTGLLLMPVDGGGW